MAAQKLFVKLMLQAEQFAKGMRTQTKAIKNMESRTKRFGDSLRGLKRLAVGVFVGWGLKKLAGSFLEASKEAEGYRVRLNTLLGRLK